MSKCIRLLNSNNNRCITNYLINNNKVLSSSSQSSASSLILCRYFNSFNNQNYNNNRQSVNNNYSNNNRPNKFNNYNNNKNDNKSDEVYSEPRTKTFGESKSDKLIQTLYDSGQYQQLINVLQMNSTELSQKTMGLAMSALLELKRISKHSTDEQKQPQDLATLYKSNIDQEDVTTTNDSLDEQQSGSSEAAKETSNFLVVMMRLCQKRYPLEDTLKFLSEMEIPKDFEVFKPLFGEARASHIVQLDIILRAYAGENIIPAGSAEQGSIFKSYISTNDYQEALRRFNNLKPTDITSHLINVIVSGFIEIGNYEEAKKIMFENKHLIKKPAYLLTAIKLSLTLGDVQMSSKFLIFCLQTGCKVPPNLIQDVLLMCGKYKQYETADRLFQFVMKASNGTRKNSIEVLLGMMLNIYHDQPDKYKQYSAQLFEIRASQSTKREDVIATKGIPVRANLHEDLEYVKHRLENHEKLRTLVKFSKKPTSSSSSSSSASSKKQIRSRPQKEQIKQINNN